MTIGDKKEELLTIALRISPLHKLRASVQDDRKTILKMTLSILI
jgi:hypothetical protein